MDFLWQQLVFFLLAVLLSLDAQRITTEEVEDQALSEKDCKWQDVNVRPGHPVPQLILNPFAAAGFKGNTLTNIPVSPERPNKPLQLTPSRETGHGGEPNSLYCKSLPKMSNPDSDQGSAQLSIKCGDTLESFYTQPSVIPPGVISVALNPPNIQTSEYFPAIRSIPFLIQLKQQSVNNYSVAIPTSGTNCPRCGFIVPPVKGCCLNPGQPIIVKKSKSKLRKFLPLILMALLKDESGHPSYCCRCCNRQASGIPMPCQ